MRCAQVLFSAPEENDEDVDVLVKGTLFKKSPKARSCTATNTLFSCSWRPAPTGWWWHGARHATQGLPGAHTWQRRWFELQPTQLVYWELSKIADGVVKKGYVLLKEVVGIRAHQRDPKRFDLLLVSKRLFELKAVRSVSGCVV